MKNKMVVCGIRSILVVLFIFLSGTILNAQEKENLKQLIDMSFEELMKIKITTAGKKSEEIKDIPASVVIITRDEIEKYGYKSLQEILNSIPGMYMISDYSAGSDNFGVRGFWSGVTNNDMIILVNGVNQVYDYISGNAMNKIAALPQAIDRIEIIRGPMSVIYGSGAFFGVINIITNEITEDGKLNNISGSIGSGSIFDLSARLSGKENDFNYAFNSSYNSTGWDKISL